MPKINRQSAAPADQKFNDLTMGWHERVHRHLGEVLCYFFVKVSPLDTPRIKDGLDKMFLARGLGSVRVFEVYGAYDLIVRAWLHRTLVKDFDLWLTGSLEGMVKVVHPFQVTESDGRWYPELSERALERIDEKVIRQVQEKGKNLRRLIDVEHLITDRTDHSRTTFIRFFVSVYFEGAGKEIYAQDGKAVADKVQQYLVENKALKFCTIDRGFGFCAMLIKGECLRQDYFEIAKLPVKLSTGLGAGRVTTETFLVHTPLPLVGHERIGQATFRAMAGKNLFAYAILPELDDDNFGRNQRDPSRRDVVVNFLAEIQKLEIDLIDRDRALIRRCLLAFVGDSLADYGKSLYGLFAGVENYLRSNYQAVIGKLEVARPVALEGTQAAGQLKKKHVVLGDLFTILSKVGQITSRSNLIFSGSDGFSELRNYTMHGDLPDIDLDGLAKFLLVLPGLRRLLEEVQQITENEYTGD